MRVNKLFVFMVTLVAGFLYISSEPVLAAAPSIYISNEVGHNLAANRAAADLLDDPWRAQNSFLGACSSCIESGALTPGATNVTNLMTTSTGVSVDISLQDMTNIADPTDLGVASNTQGSAGSATATSMQDDSPKPISHVTEPYYNENSGSTTSRNAVMIDFSSPVRSFGAFFGDLETRTDGQGTPAELRLYDASNTLLYQQVIPTTTADQSLCGSPTNDNFRGCGNDMTRWIGFIADEIDLVSKMIVIVGDDDTSAGSDDGNREHMSLLGFTVVSDYPDAPEIASAKRLVSSTNNGDNSFSVIYDMTIENNSTVSLTNLSAIDDLGSAFAGADSFSLDSYSITTPPLGPSSSISLSPTYSVGSDWELLSTGSQLEPGDTVTIRLELTVNPSVANLGPYLNQASVSGGSVLGNTVSDLSEDSDTLLSDSDSDGDPYEADDNTPTPVSFVLADLTTPTPNPTSSPEPTPEPTPEISNPLPPSPEEGDPELLAETGSSRVGALTPPIGLLLLSISITAHLLAQTTKTASQD